MLLPLVVVDHRTLLDTVQMWSSSSFQSVLGWCILRFGLSLVEVRALNEESWQLSLFKSFCRTKEDNEIVV